MVTSSLIAKIALVTIATGAVGSAIAVPLITNRNKNIAIPASQPLEQMTFNQLIQKNGYKDCYAFSSDTLIKNSLPLLLICLSETGEEYHFWNGKEFPKAQSLIKQEGPKKFLVSLENSSNSEIDIEGTSGQLKTGDTIELKNCGIKPADSRPNTETKYLSCINVKRDQSHRANEDNDSSNQVSFSLDKYEIL